LIPVLGARSSTRRGMSAARPAAVQKAVAPKRAPIRLHLTMASSIISGWEGRRGTRVWAGILGRVAALAMLAITYSIAGKLGLRLAFVHASATAVWPPTGIALAALLVRGDRVWPSILLGAFLVNV